MRVHDLVGVAYVGLVVEDLVVIGEDGDVLGVVVVVVVVVEDLGGRW